MKDTLYTDTVTWMIRLSSANMTHALGHVLGGLFQGGEIIFLNGDVGTGKTVLVQGIASGLGLPPGTVTSPTFTLIHEYPGRILLIHADLYRIDKPEMVIHTGLLDYGNQHTVVVIEWANHLQTSLPSEHFAIDLTHVSRNVRKATLRARGLQYVTLLQKIQGTGFSLEGVKTR